MKTKEELNALKEEAEMINLTDEESEQVSGGVKPEKPHRRRPSEKKSVPGVVICPQCQKPKLPHRVCPNCGYYDGRDNEDID